MAPLSVGRSCRSASSSCNVPQNKFLLRIGWGEGGRRPDEVSVIGAACSAYQDRTFRNLNCKRIQCDEIWSFCYAKDKNVPDSMKGQPGVGSVWTWVALDPDTKLVPCWFVSSRDAGAANHFMHDLAGRLAHRVQLTTDGHRPYLTAVENAFGADIDYA